MPVKIRTKKTAEDGAIEIGLTFRFHSDDFDPVRLKEFYTQLGLLIKTYLPQNQQQELLAEFDRARSKMQRRRMKEAEQR